MKILSTTNIQPKAETAVNMSSEQRNANLLRHIDDFRKHFPSLQTRDGAYNKCKFVTMELCKWLRNRNIRAIPVHIQGTDKSKYPEAHQDWQDKRGSQWTHYVVKVGNYVYDLTARQFGPQEDLVKITRYQDLQGRWDTVERDRFISKWIDELLNSGINN